MQSPWWKPTALTYPDLYQKVVLTSVQLCQANDTRLQSSLNPLLGKESPQKLWRFIGLPPRRNYTLGQITWSRGTWAGGRLHSGLTHPPFDSSTAMFVYRLLYHSVNCVITVSIYYVWGQRHTYKTSCYNQANVYVLACPCVHARNYSNTYYCLFWP